MSKKIETPKIEVELKAVAGSLNTCYKVSKIIERLESGEIKKMSEMYEAMFESAKLMTAGLFNPDIHEITQNEFQGLTKSFLELSQAL